MKEIIYGFLKGLGAGIMLAFLTLILAIYAKLFMVFYNILDKW